MRNFSYILILLFGLIKVANGQELADSNAPSQLLYLSMEELLKVKVDVSSTTPQDVFELPSVVTIIDKKQFDQYNYENVAEALADVAGVHILQTNLDRNVATFRGILQNYYMNKVLILINGIPTWQPIYGNGTLDRIHINDVDRIEVLKGPASILYGTNAYNGVINIICHQREKANTANFRFDYYYPGSAGASANVSFEKKKWRFTIAGNSLAQTRSPYNLKLSKDTASSRAAYLPDTIMHFSETYNRSSFDFMGYHKNHKIYLNTYQQEHSFLGIDITYASGAGLPFKENGFLGGYTFQKKIHDNLNVSFLLNYDRFYRLFYAVADRKMAICMKADRGLGRFSMSYGLNDKIHIHTSADVQVGRALNHEVIATVSDSRLRYNLRNDENYIESSILVQPSFDFNKVKVHTGVRYTYNKQSGQNVSPQMSLVYELNKHNTLKTLYSEAFRSPSMLEMYFDHPTVVGDSSLKHETNKSFELVYLYNKRSSFLQAILYYSVYEDLIQRVGVGPSTYENFADLHAYGCELEYKYAKPENWNCFISYSYMKENNEHAKSNFELIPEHTISTGITKYYKQFSFASNAYFYSGVNGLLDKIPEQYKWNIHAGYYHNIWQKFELKHVVSVKNITGSEMLIPQYSRPRDDINTMATMGFGSYLLYTLKVKF